MQARGIRFSPEDLAKFESAMGKAESKGAKNTLLLSDAAAMIVNVKDKTVVTVMDKANLKENVFTNIDSTVMV
jgi:flagellar operon protein